MTDEPKTEAEGSSLKTAVAVGLGAVATVALAPVLAPVVGAVGLVAVLGTAGLAAIGGGLGYVFGGKK